MMLRHAGRRAAFTLVEALVAVGLTSLMLWGLLQLFTSATTFSSTVTTEAELVSAGRAVLERMVRETSAASLLDSHTLVIGADSGEFETLSCYAPVGNDGAEVVQVQYRATGASGSTTRALERKAGTGPWAPFGLNVERLDISYIDANGTAGTGAKTFSTTPPLAIGIEIRMSDTKQRATIALTSSAFLPGSGF